MIVESHIKPNFIAYNWRKFKRSRAWVILESFHESQLGTYLYIVLIILIAIGIFYWWWLTQNGFIKTPPKRNKVEDGAVAFLLIFIELIAFMIIFIIIAGTCNAFIDFTSKVEKNLIVYDVEAAQFVQKRQT